MIFTSTRLLRPTDQVDSKADANARETVTEQLSYSGPDGLRMPTVPGLFLWSESRNSVIRSSGKAKYNVMNKFVIGYDLLKPGQDYNSLLEAIKSVGSTWWHCLDSTWIVITNRTAMQVRDYLAPHMDANDELLVISCSSPAAWRGFDDECSNWLKTNL